jgi:hypothetical protein
MGCPAPTAFRLAQGVGRTSRREWPVSLDGTPRDVVERGAGNWAIKPTRSLPRGDPGAFAVNLPVFGPDIRRSSSFAPLPGER